MFDVANYFFCFCVCVCVYVCVYVLLFVCLLYLFSWEIIYKLEKLTSLLFFPPIVYKLSVLFVHQTVANYN